MVVRTHKDKHQLSQHYLWKMYRNLQKEEACKEPHQLVALEILRKDKPKNVTMPVGKNLYGGKKKICNVSDIGQFNSR